MEGLFNEKGNLKAAARKEMKDQVIASLVSAGYEVKPNGKLAKVILEAEGHVFTANIDLAVGVDTDFSKKEKASKAKEAVEVPTLDL